MRDQQWILFSLLISTHEIFSMSESIVLKFNYSDSIVLSTTFFYKHRLQCVWIQCSLHSKYVWFICQLIQIHKFRKILIILIKDSSYSIHLSKFTALAYKTRRRQRQQAKQTHNLLLSIVVVVFGRESYLFCDSCKCWVKESRNQRHLGYC